VRYFGAVLHASRGLDDVAFLNPDGTRVLVVYNNSPRWLRFEVDAPDRGTLSTTMAARATDTLVWR
jgi:O-glycosyl hydrolase